ncbi:hypothetical protein M438DRAFT_270235 [Aureobasidium pullulans EXF-150]|uniref:Uncharacterized protein n=1 Tax=Aureobasidium pullulans EXF-150 TaxID=1043002 RepID=A0A074XKM4_AURPU|nr:uncharacterized protein M438DRAFT_270235 [Aureobasidium pullulans EXF-150]KEQ86053.1 hypothetical protein M438DRAFT_270235 [Aureobasidium pullulans EXF-150]
MSAEYQNQDPIKLATQAEQDLNSHTAKHGHNADLSSNHAAESGVDESVRNKFPGADVTYGSAASGAGNNRDIPLSEGGDINPSTGKLYKAGDFEGAGGPETKAQIHRENAGGNDEVRSNIRN